MDSGRYPARPPGSPSSGALCALKPKYPRAGGWRASARDKEARPAGGVGGASARRGSGEGLGPQERPRRGGAPGRGRAEPRGRESGGRGPRGPGAGGRAPLAPLTCQAGRRVQEAREGGRGDTAALAAAAAAAACPALGRAARGSGTCLRPCDPGAAPAAAPAGKPPPPRSPAPALPSGPRPAGGLWGE